MHRRQVLDYLALALIWGASFVLMLKVSQAFGWAAATAFRALIASAVLLILARAMRRQLTFARWWAILLVGATTVAGQLIGLQFSIPLIGTAMAAILVGTIPLFTMLLAHLWGTEHMSGLGILGLFLGLVGVVLLVGFPAVPITATFLLGCLVMLGGAMAAALGSNVARRYLGGVGAWEQTMGAFFFGGLILLPLILVVPIPTIPGFWDYLTLLALAAVCSALAYVLFFRLVAEVGPTIAISVEFLVTVIAVVIGALFLGERLSIVQLLGGAIIIVGCTLVLGLLPRRRSAASAR